MNPPPNLPSVERLLEHASWARSLARALVADGASADDVVQETWLAALKTPPDPSRPPRPWLARVIGNFAREGRRRDVRRVDREERTARERPRDIPSASELVERAELHRILVEEIVRLPEPYRSSVLLRYFEGLDAAEIAARDGVPAATVRSRLMRALDRLRERLDARHGGERKSWLVVLAPFARGSSAAGALAGVSGALTMKAIEKIGIAVALALVALVGGWKLVSAPSAPEPRERAGDPSLAAAQRPADAAPAVAALKSTSSPAREAIASVPAVPAAVPEGSARIEARIVDRSRRPIAGAVLRSVTPHAAASEPARDDGKTSLTIELKNPDVWNAELHVAAAGFATQACRPHLHRGRTTYLGDVTLEAGATIVGRVVDGQDCGVAGALVQATGPEISVSGASDVKRALAARRRGPIFRVSPVQATTAADGTYVLEGIETGSRRVWAMAPGMRYSFTSPLVLAPRQRAEAPPIALEAMQADDRIAGVVLDPDRKPVADAYVGVGLQSSDYSESGAITTDSAGRFEFRVPGPATIDLTVSDPQGRWPSVDREGLKPGGEDLEIRFLPTRRVEVRAVSRDGAPVEGIEVQVASAERNTPISSAVRTTAPGVASFFVPAEPFVVTVAAAGFEVARLGPHTPEAAPESLRCELAASPAVRGRVLASGRPLSGAKITARDLAQRGSRIVHNGFASLVNPHPRAKATSGADGRYVFSIRSAGRFMIRVEADGYAPAEIGPVELAPRSDRDGLDFDLGPGGTIEGAVLVPDGGDPTGIIVGISRGDSRPQTLRVGPDGAYRFERLTPGPWQLVRADEEANPVGGPTLISSDATDGASAIPRTCTVVEGKTTRYDLDLRRDDACRLEGQLVLDGASAVGWTASLTTLGGVPPEGAGEKPASELDGAGRFRLAVREPGRYRLSLAAADDDAALRLTSVVELSRGETAWRETLALGRVEGAWKRPMEALPRMLVYSWIGNENFRASFVLHPDPDGRFALPVVPAGKGSIGSYKPAAEGKPAKWEPYLEVEVLRGGTVQADVK